jgi:hypothetical protein
MSGESALSQATAVGQGFNVYGPLDVSSLTQPIVDATKAGTVPFRFQGVDYTIPSYVVAHENPQTYVVKAVSETREQAQNDLSVHAGVGGTYGAFSGEIQADFGYSSTTTADSFLCYWRSYAPLAVLGINASKAKAYLTDDFVAAVNALPVPLSVNENRTAYFDFFAAYGPFYTRSITIGGELSVFNQVSKSSQLTAVNLALALQAQYDGLYTTGKLDVSVIGQQNWSRYQQNSTVSIKANGGNPELAVRLSGADPWAFAQPSVDLYAKWAASLATQPAVVDFQVGGVWELVADHDRARALQEAWQLYANLMHPRASIQTASSRLIWPNQTNPKPPIVIVGSQLRPATPPKSPVGLQAIVLNGDDVTGPDAVVFDRFYTLPVQQEWVGTYRSMWDSFAQEVSGSYDAAGNILIVTTFGLDRNMPPTDDALALLETAGAGPVVNNWIRTCSPGSSLGQPGVWIGFPHNYAMLGVFGNPPGTAVESVTDDPGRAELDLQIHLYRERFDGQYTIAAG